MKTFQFVVTITPARSEITKEEIIQEIQDSIPVSFLIDNVEITEFIPETTPKKEPTDFHCIVIRATNVLEPKPNLYLSIIANGLKRKQLFMPFDLEKVCKFTKEEAEEKIKKVVGRLIGYEKPEIEEY